MKLKSSFYLFHYFYPFAKEYVRWDPNDVYEHWLNRKMRFSGDEQEVMTECYKEDVAMVDSAFVGAYFAQNESKLSKQTYHFLKDSERSLKLKQNEKEGAIIDTEKIDMQKAKRLGSERSLKLKQKNKESAMIEQQKIDIQEAKRIASAAKRRETILAKEKAKIDAAAKVC